MKKICLLLCVILLTGCANKTSVQNNIQEENEYSYVYETDCQCNIGLHPNRAYTQKGMYYFEVLSENMVLRFVDKQSGKDVPVCGKADCNHTNLECDAYFSKKDYPLNNLWYLEDMLYVPKVEDDYINIEKITPDGAQRTNSCTLTRLFIETIDMGNGVVESSTTYPEIQLHRGYAYISTYYPGEENASLYRIKLGENDEPEELATIEEKNNGMVMLYRIKPYGGSILFQMGEYKESGNTVSIYEYNLLTETCSLLCENVIKDYAVLYGELYYLDENENIYKMNLDTNEKELYYANDNRVKNALSTFNTFFEYDGNIVFRREIEEITEAGEIQVYWIQLLLDDEGNIIDEIDIDGNELLPEYYIE